MVAYICMLHSNTPYLDFYYIQDITGSVLGTQPPNIASEHGKCKGRLHSQVRLVLYTGTLTCVCQMPCLYPTVLRPPIKLYPLL